MKGKVKKLCDCLNEIRWGLKTASLKTASPKTASLKTASLRPFAKLLTKFHKRI